MIGCGISFGDVSSSREVGVETAARNAEDADLKFDFVGDSVLLFFEGVWGRSSTSIAKSPILSC